MPDDRSKQDGCDRSSVAGSEEYEVQYLADKTGVTPEQVRKLITMHGTDRKILEIEAKKLLAPGS